jgi:hypothetical protein
LRSTTRRSRIVLTADEQDRKIARRTELQGEVDRINSELDSATGDEQEVKLARRKELQDEIGRISNALEADRTGPPVARDQKDGAGDTA